MAVSTSCRCFIVPPGILEHIMREGEPDEREAARRTLSIDHAVRAGRIQAAALTAAMPRPRPVQVPQGGKPARTVFDAEHTDNQNATKVLRTESDPAVTDQAANDVYDGFGDTYDLYWTAYSRNSIDDAGMSLLGEVHFQVNYNNAFWDGRRMMFGDGDQKTFIGFTKSVDVIGHELTHGVTQHTLNLVYSGQSGALNESISDVFGSLVKQYANKQDAASADWLIGEGIMAPKLGKALRSMKAPGTAWAQDDQPSTMSGYVHTTDDNGGVHTNSGIPNHAFYLAATAIGGFAWEKAGEIWYETLLDSRLSPTAQFSAFARGTVRAAQRLYGHGSTEEQAVAEAWAQVGVLAAPAHKVLSRV